MNYYKAVEAMLYTYRQAKTEIKNILIEIEEIENTYRGIGAINYDDMPKAHNVSSSVEAEVEEKEQRIEYLNQLTIKKENQVKKIDNALEALEDRELEIIELRYFNKISNREIGRKLNLTEQRVCIIKRNVINKLIQLIFH